MKRGSEINAIIQEKSSNPYYSLCAWIRAGDIIPSEEICKKVARQQPVKICPACGGDVIASVKKETLTHEIWSRLPLGHYVLRECLECGETYSLNETDEMRNK